MKKTYITLISFVISKLEKQCYKKFYIFLMCWEKYEVYPSVLFMFVTKHIAVQKRAFSFFISFLCFKATAIKIHMFLVDFIGSIVVSTVTVRLCVHKYKNMTGTLVYRKTLCFAFLFYCDVLFCNFFISGMLSEQNSSENISLVNFYG